MESKVCMRCGETKPLTAYTSSGRGRQGEPRRRARCKECLAVEHAEWRATHPRKPSEYRATVEKRAAAVIEDVEFMLTHRESMFMAAARLGTGAPALERYLQRQGRPDLIRGLKGNQNEHAINQFTKEIF